MPGWFWIGLGCGLAAWMWRITFRAIHTSHADMPVTGEDLGEDVGLATLMFWIVGPGVLLLGALRRLGHAPDWESVGRMLAGETRAQKLKRREAELSDREAHIAQVERELGL